MTKLVDLTADLAEVVSSAGDDEALPDLLRRGLDWVARLVDYDLATIFELEGDVLIVRVARGPLAGKVREHRLDLGAFPTIREALETRRARAYTEDDHAHGDGDPFDGVLDLPPGHSCMVVPLCAGDDRYGVLTLDRSRCESYAPEIVSLVEVYAQVLSLAIQNARQRSALSRLSEQHRVHAATLEDMLAPDPHGVLESSESPRVRALVAQAKQVAATATPVLLFGETGTGKERLARAIHLWSERRDRPFVTLNCAAIPETLIESELFGHVAGAFTGATRDRPGRFQVANGGTLLLDEIGELPLSLQPKLLRVLQEGTFQPVGSDETRKVDVRVIAATHLDLEAAAGASFREDLYYRLAVFPLRLPPLRDRLEDLPRLTETMLAEQARRTGRHTAIDPAAIGSLRGYAWPGNLRELSNVLERASILSRTGTIEAHDLDLAPSAKSVSRPAPSVMRTLQEVERAHIEQVLGHTGGKLYGDDGAAVLLGLKPSTLQSRMKKLGIDRSRFTS